LLIYNYLFDADLIYIEFYLALDNTQGNMMKKHLDGTDRRDKEILLTAMTTKFGDIAHELIIATGVAFTNIAQAGGVTAGDYYQVFGALTLQKMRGEFVQTLGMIKGRYTSKDNRKSHLESVTGSTYLMVLLTDVLLQTNEHGNELEKFNYKGIVDEFLSDMAKEYDTAKQNILLAAKENIGDDLNFEELKELVLLAKEIKNAKRQ
jgi:hypothetical protein